MVERDDELSIRMSSGAVTCEPKSTMASARRYTGCRLLSEINKRQRLLARPSSGEKLATIAAQLGAAVKLKGSYVLALEVLDVILSLADDVAAPAGVTRATINELKSFVTPSDGPFASTLAFRVRTVRSTWPAYAAPRPLRKSPRLVVPSS